MTIHQSREKQEEIWLLYIHAMLENRLMTTCPLILGKYSSEITLSRIDEALGGEPVGRK